MDSTAAFADFSLNIGGAAQLAIHLQVVVGGVLPQQQQPLLAENVNDSSSHVSVIPLHIMEHKLQPSSLYPTPTKLFR
jgi:hypothetical protein